MKTLHTVIVQNRNCLEFIMYLHLAAAGEKKYPPGYQTAAQECRLLLIDLIKTSRKVWDAVEVNSADFILFCF